MSSPIPVRNIYYLLLYAWNKLPEGELIDVSGIDDTELVNLFAVVLLGGANHLLRRGLDQGYIAHQEELAGIRGRIEIGATVRRMLTAHGRAYCQFDELSVDIQSNRILRSTVRRLIRLKGLDRDLSHQLQVLDRKLGGISEIQLHASAFRSVQLHSNNRFYRFLLDICRLVVDSMIVDEATGERRFQDFIRDEKKMARLFEDFVFNFLSKEKQDLKISSDLLFWQATSEADPNLSYLPSMRTDISVRSPLKTLIIDTKYYKETFQSRYDRQSVHSNNLYQILAYLKNLEQRGGQDAEAEGMLLYPTVNEKVRLDYSLPGHRVRVCTVDLSRDWRHVKQELLDLVA